MRSTVATINTKALDWNFSVIRRKAPHAAICAMVKANAYGHGMVQCARLLEKQGASFLGVAFVDEGVVLREAGITCPILVLTPNEPHHAGLIAAHRLSVVICSVAQAEELRKAAGLGVPIQGHLYVDSGMHRDGFPAHEVEGILKQIVAMPGLHINGICTHLATADVRNDPFVREQLQLFGNVLSRAEQMGFSFDYVHAANTGAIWQDPSSFFTMVRPGLSLYGYANPADDMVQLRPVMSLTSVVLSVRRLWPGETVSYGRRYMTAKETSIATVPIGYGDGYLRALSGKAQCLIGGKRYPVVGSVCMDEVMVDVGDDQVQAGDAVVLLGMQADAEGNVQSIDATELAQWAGTIPWEITTAVSARVPRVFV